MSLRNLLLPLLFTGAAIAAPVTGTVTNKTTNKHAANVEVSVLRMQQGLGQVAQAKTDAKGEFKLDIPESEGSTPHLIQVQYEGASYSRFAPPGTQSVEIEVFDAAKQVPNVAGSADVMMFQATGSELQVIETLVVRNDSKPPCTQVSDKGFEFYLPEGAKVLNASAGRVNGMPVATMPLPENEKNRYSLNYPLRPGETMFRVTYNLPYTGKASFTPHLLMPVDDFVVMLAPGMKLDPKSSGFGAAPDANGMHVAVVKAVQPNDRVAFEVSGEGQIPQDSNTPEGANNQMGGNAADNAGNTNGTAPGGGIGQPINTPNPLDKYKWWIFGGVTLALIAGAGYAMGRPEDPAAPVSKTPVDRHALLLEALKEELFRLESDRAAGKVSEAEYQQYKAAFDLVLKRALNAKKTGAVTA